jgi:thioredoxin reductase/pSer/pThr/pTyr-binding forkhead associated (FHA) protein/ferredoxin
MPGNEDYTSAGTLKVESRVPLPEIVDVFIAGGGPAGTAAALRAKELGLGALVIDSDDLMRRIRDYPKNKLILPNYGGDDTTPFPPAGELIRSLHFDDSDKDELVAHWKQQYRRNSIQAKIGSEFRGLERQADGTWLVKTWNERISQDVVYRARSVLLALGAGDPRKFDVPGDTEGIALRLDDAANYVGAPAVVIGGGTSAAEAVIAISNAKAKAEDQTAIYWSYRGGRMPKVSKALSTAFFDAYVGNGNIRHMAFSEPVAVVVGPDKKGYLALRIDRKIIEQRPVETVHLEFPKDKAIACIGGELPIEFIQRLGIKLTEGKRPMILLDENGQTSLPGIYLIGDVRGPVFVQCIDFDDASTYQRVRLERNIKASMWDAVRAVEAIARAAGKAVAVEARSVAPRSKPPSSALHKPIPPSPPGVSLPAEESLQAWLVSLRGDGSEAERLALHRDVITIGRSGTDVVCAEDVHMEPLHVRLVRRADRYFLEDPGTASGVWHRVGSVQPRVLSEDDFLWLGSQILKVIRHDGAWALEHYKGGNLQDTLAIGEPGLFVGRGAGETRAPEAVLDEADTFLSRRHAQLRIQDGRLTVLDMKSKNGTFTRLAAPLRLEAGDEFHAGNKRFRFDLSPSSEPFVAEAAVVATPPAGAAPAGAFPVVIEHPQHPVSFPVAAGQTVLDAFIAYLKERHPEEKPEKYRKKPLNWECKGGTCGLCAIQILEGVAHLTGAGADAEELNTLEVRAFVEPDPKQFRLACKATIDGPVKLAMPE